MEYNHIFSKYRPKTECFPDFGFIADDSSEGIYSCKKNLNVEGFFAELKIDVKRNVLEAHVFDGNSSERYALFDVASAQGNFVGIIREQVQMIIDDFCAKCCSSKNLLSDYLDFISRRFSVEAEFPWEDESSKSNGKSNGRRSLVVCSPWGHTESDTTEETQQQQQTLFIGKRFTNLPS